MVRAMQLKPISRQSLMFLAACVGAALLLTVLRPEFAIGQQTVKLELYALDSDRLLYTGVRTERFQGEIRTETTIYMKLDGTRVQRVETAYNTTTLKLVSYKLGDFRSGQREEMQVSGNSVTLLNQEGKKEKPETETLQWGPNFTFGSSVVPRILRAWDGLQSGKALTFDLLIPSRLETLVFRIKKDSDTKIQGKSVVVMRMEPDSWIIRQLVDPMFFYITAVAPRRLEVYKGRSSIKTDEGDTQDLRIVFKQLPGK